MPIKSTTLCSTLLAWCLGAATGCTQGGYGESYSGDSLASQGDKTDDLDTYGTGGDSGKGGTYPSSDDGESGGSTSGTGPNAGDGPADDGDTGGDHSVTEVIPKSWVSFTQSQFVDGTVDVGEGPFTSVVMIAEVDSPCFPFDRWQSDPPPPGHLFPPGCDPFSRRVMVTLDPDGSGEFANIDLLRGTTALGGPMSIQQDVTDIFNGAPGKHTIRAKITTYNDEDGQAAGQAAGWHITVRMETRSGPAPREIAKVKFIASADVTANDDDRLEQAFVLDENLPVSSLRYFTTGHGSEMVSDCPYLSDEYCQREQVIRIDGVEVARFTPWRDCSGTCDLQSYDSPGGGAPETQYCLQNPMTDSAEGMTRARSNWCPSQGVVPTEIPLPELSAGEHTLEIEVSRIPAGSARWWVSAALLAP